MNKVTPNLICTRPWQWCEVHPDGSVFLCCPAWLKRSIGNLLQQPFGAIWNGPIAQEIRKSILNGSFHNCNRTGCPHLHQGSSPLCEPGSLSDSRLKTAIGKQRATLDFLPSQLNLCFDHSCNLACPSCRTQPLAADGSQRHQADQIASILIEQLLPTAESVTLSGFGDPFASPSYRNILQRLNRRDYPQLQRLRLHSNGQLFTPAAWASLPDLQPLLSEVEISIDAATAATYALNRPGGDFARLLQNLEFIAGLDAELTLSMVVQENNWHEIPQLLELAERLRAKVYLSRLVNWGTFSKDEYSQRAVHLAQHPQQDQLIQLLQGVRYSDGLNLGNLSDLLK